MADLKQQTIEEINRSVRDINAATDVNVSGIPDYQQLEPLAITSETGVNNLVKTDKQIAGMSPTPVAPTGGETEGDRLKRESIEREALRAPLTLEWTSQAIDPTTGKLAPTGGKVAKQFLNPGVNQEEIQRLVDQGWTVSEGALPENVKTENAPQFKGQATPVVPEDPQLKIAKEEAEALQLKLKDLAAGADSALASQIESINQTFGVRIRQMEDVNRRRVEAQKALGVRLGSRWAGGFSGQFGGIISEEESQGISRIGELEAQKQSLIASAKQAAATQNWTQYSKLADMAEAKVKSREEEVKKVNEAIIAQNKKVKEEQTKNRINTEIINDVIAGSVGFDTLFKKYGEKYPGQVNPKDILDLIEQYQKVNPNAYESAIGKEYNDYIKSENKEGRTPVDFNTYQNLDANRKAIIAKASNAGLDFKSINVINKHQTEFSNSPIIKDFIIIQEKLDTVNRIIQSGVGGPGDLAIVFEFMKGLDPTSVVRETEYANAAKTGNIFLGLLARYNGYLKEEGGFLPENVKQGFLQIVDQKYRAKVQQYDNLKSEKARIINKQLGITDGDQYLVDYKQAINTPPEKPQDVTLRDPKTGELKKFSNLTAEEINQALSQGFERVQ